MDGSPMRCTLSLSNEARLRGISLSRLLGCAGRQLRSSSSSECNYHKSFPVHELDIFLSHSWSSSWLVKVVTLLLYFNAVPAVVIGMSIAFLSVSLLQYSAIGAWFPDHQTVSLVAGTAATLLTLVFWQNFLKLAGAPVKSIFLDKACIHQTDSYLKAKGIRSISGVLAHSRVLLLALDTTYFNRLWCPFEVSAFTAANPSKPIVVLPLQLGSMTAALSATSLVVAIVMSYVAMPLTFKAGALPNTLYFWLIWWIAFFLRCFPYAVLLSRYSKDLVDLEIQLATYSVRAASSFCCQNNHINPISGDHMPCDRELVFESISYWHGGAGNDREKGLDAFDVVIHCMWDSVIKKTLGSVHIPYPFALLPSLWGALLVLASFSDRPERGLLFTTISSLQILLCNDPISINIMSRITQAFHDSRNIRNTPFRTLCGILFAAIVGALIPLLSIAVEVWVIEPHLHRLALQFVFQAFVVFLLFDGRQRLLAPRKISGVVTAHAPERDIEFSNQLTSN